MTNQLSVLQIAQLRVEAIRSAGITIYDPTLPRHPNLLFEDEELEAVISEALVGTELSGPPRTRSKVAKELVAEAMGYDPPSSFKKTQPRFPGQNLDVYVQASDNLQIWNEEISPERRYVLIRPDAEGIVRAVRVVPGQQVAKWDRTGTLSSKFQAKRKPGRNGSKLVSNTDTASFCDDLEPSSMSDTDLARQASGARPIVGSVLPVSDLFQRLTGLIGTTLPAVESHQDRIRGELLQEAVSNALNLGWYENHGQWPDIVSQALEVKLQTSPTIDLGLVLPTDDGPATALSPTLKHYDARYVVAYGELDSQGATTIKEVVVVTGLDFFSEFEQFGGLVQNDKLQMPLPSDLFDSKS